MKMNDEQTDLLIDTSQYNDQGVGKVIGHAKAHYFPKLDSRVSKEVRQRLMLYYRVIPEYETEQEAVDLLFAAAVHKAMKLKDDLEADRKCYLCTSCTPSEEFYINYIVNQGYTEGSGAFDSERLIGKVMAGQSEDDVPEVESVSVLGEYQGKGIAAHMLSIVMGILKERNAEQIKITVKNDNQPAIHLYHKMGFKEYRNEKTYYKEEMS